MTPERSLALLALAIAVAHHVGSAFAPLGTVGQTRWADWVDLLVPYAVLGAAAAVLHAVRADRGCWLLLAAGGLGYTQGHGIHLSANSIGNEQPSDLVHLWDEVVGHYVWYAGWFVVLAAVALALTATRVRVPAAGWLLAALTALTLFTNSVEGGTPVLTLVVAAAFCAWAWRRRRTDAGRLTLAVFLPAAVLLAAWGVRYGGFPQFTELGWL